MIVLRSAAVVLTILGVSASLAAQTTEVRSGQRVRVTTADSVRHEGRLLLVAADTVFLQRSGHQELVKMGSGDRLDVLKGSHAYTLLGALIGAVGGAVAGSTSSRHICAPLESSTTIVRYCGLSPAAGALVYGAAGLGVGALVGSLVRKSVWEPVPGAPGALRVTIAPLPEGGLVAGASLAFGAHRPAR